MRIDGRPHKGDTGNAREAEARTWLTAYRKQVHDAKVGLMPPPEAAPAITLADLVALYVEKRGPLEKGEGAVTPHTLQALQLTLRLHWQPIAAKPIDQITTAEVEDMRQAYLAGDGRRTKGGANKIVSRLITVLRWAMGRGLLSEMPFQIARMRYQKPIKAIVWPEQQRAFLQASRKCRHADARLGLLAGLTMGLREAEILGMRWEWFSWTAQIYQVGLAKDMEPRAIPMHPVFYRVMRTRWISRGKPTKGLVLHTADDAPRHPGYLRKPTDTTARAMGIVGLHPHSLRASFATAQWEAGATIAQLQGWLGHEDAATTMLYIVKRDLPGREIQRRVASRAGWPEPKPVPVQSPKTKPKSLKRSKHAA